MDPKSERMPRQKKVFTNWINYKLASRAQHVDDLYEDLKDGWVLYALLEELSGQSLQSLGKMTTKTTKKIQKVANMNIPFIYLRDTMKIVGIGPQDIVDSTNEILILGLVWSIIVFSFGGEDQVDLKKIKTNILTWVNEHTGKKIQNLGTDLADGRVFIAIMNQVNSNGPQLEATEEPLDNLARAFHLAETKYGVPLIMDIKDPLFWKDDKAVVPQLHEMMKRFVKIDKEEEAQQAGELAHSTDRTDMCFSCTWCF